MTRCIRSIHRQYILSHGNSPTPVLIIATVPYGTKRHGEPQEYAEIPTAHVACVDPTTHSLHSAAPAAPTKPTKRDDSGVALESLFADWEDATPSLKEDVRGNLPVLERPGSWESKIVEGGMICGEVLRNQMGRH